MADVEGPHPAELFIHRYTNHFGDVEYDVIEPGEMADAVGDGDMVGMYRLHETYRVRVQVSLEDGKPAVVSDVPF
jgi:hypothetical protein